ncbi:MAG: PHP domain-containing protein, partial [Bacteroidota bacterium]
MHEFVHLHNHTHYSLLDAMPTVPQLIDAALEDNQKALALTDHGVMHGAIEFYYKAKAKGLKPLIGMEAYVANGSRFDKTPRSQLSGKKEKQYFHLVLLAKDMTGYCNLVKLTSLGHTEGFYYKPRVDKELLEQYREGLVALSACIGGVVNIHLVNGDFEKAREEARYYQQLYGDDFYIELQDHGLKPDKIVLRDAPRIAQDLGIKIVATNDIHYISKDHAVAHNVLLHIRDVTAATAGTVDIEKLRYQQPEFWFKSQQDMN